MTIRKKIITSSLLLILLAPLFYVLSFQWQRAMIRERAKERLEERMLQTLTIRTADLKWNEPGEELSINNKFFDLKTIHDNGDGTITVTGLFDEQETALLEQLQQLEEQNNKGGKELTGFFQFWTAIQDTSNPVLKITSTNNNQEYLPFISRLSSAYISISTPPPQF